MLRPFPTPCWNSMTAFEQGSIRLYGRVVSDDHPAAISVAAAATYCAPQCNEPGTVAVEMAGDETPGPRIYCPSCAQTYLHQRQLASTPNPRRRP